MPSLQVVFAIALAFDLSGCLSSGSPQAPAGPQAQSPTPTPSPNPSPTSTGGIVIVVPSPPPVLCTPAPVVIAVAQQTVISCAQQGYIGPLTFTVANPAIASVKLAAGTFTLFYVTGVSVGTTSLSLESSSGGVGQTTIQVTAH